jgi:Ca-activated chloride channel homolog
MGLPRSVVVSALAAVVLAAASVPVGTQAGTASIEGTVTDTLGAVIPGVTVVAAPVAGGRTHSAVSDAKGRYRLEGLTPGAYDVTARLQGFTPAAQRVALAAGGTTTANFTLTVGALAETVVVSGRASTVMTSTAMTSATAIQPWRWPSAPFRTTSFDTIDENPFLATTANPLSTFSVDVDTASYAYLRRAITSGSLPPADAVRIEEMLNYFRYDYPEPRDDRPFTVTTEVGPCPWQARHLLLHVGLQARTLAAGRTPPRNLVFLLDVSGSMQPPDKLPLVKSAMSLLVNRLTARDTVAIVVYAGSSGVVLPATRGDQQALIQDAIARLQAGGTTNGAEGLELAYSIARERFVRDGVNRVILATDGDFNVGVTSRGALVDLIEEKRRSGIFLSILGVGDDNLKDGTMEQLADRGNGNYAYLDTLEEAQKVLVREADATLVTVSKDVKIQVEFNPARVASYRLIGYENRVMRAEDFKDDRKDAGEMGAGHSVTALYEVVPAGRRAESPGADRLRYQQERALSTAAATDEMAIVKLRYKRPDADVSVPLEAMARMPGGGEVKLTANLGFSSAVAAFGMLLRNSQHKGDASWRMAADLAARHRGPDPDGYRAQFARLVEMAEGIAKAQGHGGER